MKDPWERLLDNCPPSIDEAVIKAYDAVRDYRALLRDLADDAKSGELDLPLDKLAASIELCGKLIEELEGWGLNPTLTAR